MKRIYLQKISQNSQEYFIGKADPRELVRIAAEIEVSTPQDAQRPLNGKRVKSIATYIDTDLGILPNTLVIATNNEKLQVHKCDLTDNNNTKINMYYLDFPSKEEEFEEYKNSLDVMDGQHRLYAFKDDFVSMSDNIDFEIGFTLFITPTLEKQRQIFMVCNEKQEKVSGNLLMWFREKLNMLDGMEKEFYPLISSLNSENISPLKGRIIMGGEKIKNGIKANQLVRVFDKAKIQNLTYSKRTLTEQERLHVICVYLKAWEKVCGFNLKEPTRNDGPAYKISGIRFLMLLLPSFWDQCIKRRESFNLEHLEELIKRFIDERGVLYDEFFTCKDNNAYFKSETTTIQFASECSIDIKNLDAVEFNPLA